MKSKIHRARVTGTELHYEGSLTLDPYLMERAAILPWEQIQVVNVNNGERLETYVIPGKESGNGEVVLNGPAARRGEVGDEVIIISYGHLEEAQARGYTPTVVRVDEKNRPVQ